jgi:hypothetical protein
MESTQSNRTRIIQSSVLQKNDDFDGDNGGDEVPEIFLFLRFDRLKCYSVCETGLIWRMEADFWRSRFGFRLVWEWVYELDWQVR